MTWIESVYSDVRHSLLTARESDIMPHHLRIGHTLAPRKALSLQRPRIAFRMQATNRPEKRSNTSSQLEKGALGLFSLGGIAGIFIMAAVGIQSIFEKRPFVETFPVKLGGHQNHLLG